MATVLSPLLNVLLFSGSTCPHCWKQGDSRLCFKQLSLPSCWTRPCDAIKHDAKLELLSCTERQGRLVLAHAVPLQAQNLGKACWCLHGICYKTYTVMEV